MLKLLFTLFLLSSSAFATSINMQPFYVTHSKGSYFLEDALSENSNLVKNYKMLAYFGYSYADNPLVVIEDKSNKRIDIEAKQQHLLSFGAGFFLRKNLYVGASSFLTFVDLRQNAIANPTAPFTNDVSLGDTRLLMKWRFAQGEKYAFALIPEIIFNTGSKASLTTDDSFGGALRLAYERKLGTWADLYFNVGYVATPNAEYKNIRMHNRGSVGVGLWIPFSRKLSLNGEWNGQLAIPYDNNQNPTEFYAGLRYAFNESVALFGGIQTTGFGEDVSTDFKASAALKWTPQKKVAVVPVVVEPVKEVPAIVEPVKVTEEVKKEVQAKLNLASLFQFNFASDKLTDESVAICKDIANSLVKNAAQIAGVTVDGHTDHVGTNERNLILSQNRANSVKKCLAYYGVQDSMIQATGYGESKPKIEGITKEADRINRRVELNVSYK
jgi:outer membrane protein OmpA-like peptidoglycan-associated protein